MIAVTFTPGDVVQLKSGGPPMTVEVVGEDGMVACSWMDGKKLERRSFVAAVLQVYQHHGPRVVAYGRSRGRLG